MFAKHTLSDILIHSESVHINMFNPKFDITTIKKKIKMLKVYGMDMIFH